jgi:hypothetical protein
MGLGLWLYLAGELGFDMDCMTRDRVVESFPWVALRSLAPFRAFTSFP